MKAKLFCASFCFAIAMTGTALAQTPEQQKILDELTTTNDDVLAALDAHKNPNSLHKADLQNKVIVQRWIDQAKKCQDLVDKASNAGLAGGYQFAYDTHGMVGLSSPLPLASYGRDLCAPAQQRSEETLSTLP